MELASDITSEDLQVFLQEAEEHLQLLDEDIVRLEREQDNKELLQYRTYAIAILMAGFLSCCTR